MTTVSGSAPDLPVCALCGDEEHPEHLAVVLFELPDRVVVEDRLVDGHRDELLDLEAERRAELLLREERQRDLTDDHALVPEPYAMGDIEA